MTDAVLSQDLRVALYITGSTKPEIRYRYGDFEDWFAAFLTPYGVETTTFDVRKGKYPDITAVDGIIITGSSASVCTNPPDWVPVFITHLQDIIDSGIPTLGVCFGHQILAAAAGGVVEPHPDGRESGPTELQKTTLGKSDRLFQDIPEKFRVNMTHEDVVVRSPNGRVLAYNDYNGFQAIRYSDTIQSVQFHPEFTAAIMEQYTRVYHSGRSGVNDSTGEEQGTSKESSVGRTILANFVNILRLNIAPDKN